MMLEVSKRRDKSMMIILMVVNRVEEAAVNWYSGHWIAVVVNDGN